MPGGIQGYDRYSYTNNNPVKYVDPSGHISVWCENDPNSPQCKGYVADQAKLGSSMGKTNATSTPVPPKPKPVVNIYCGFGIDDACSTRTPAGPEYSNQYPMQLLDEKLGSVQDRK